MEPRAAKDAQDFLGVRLGFEIRKLELEDVACGLLYRFLALDACQIPHMRALRGKF